MADDDEASGGSRYEVSCNGKPAQSACETGLADISTLPPPPQDQELEADEAYTPPVAYTPPDAYTPPGEAAAAQYDSQDMGPPPPELDPVKEWTQVGTPTALAWILWGGEGGAGCVMPCNTTRVLSEPEPACVCVSQSILYISDPARQPSNLASLCG